jgi:DNA-binding NtrC family response regulator
MSHVLVVGEDASCVRGLFAGIADEGWECASWNTFFTEKLSHFAPGLLVLVGLPEPSHLLESIQEVRSRRVPAAVITVLPSNLNATEFVHVLSLADDFVLWPERPEVIQLRIARLLPAASEIQGTCQHLMLCLSRANLVGQDRAFMEIAEQARLAAESVSPVLITGETGTGKELLAHTIHSLSPRRNQAFIPVDCAGLPEHLFENELFGHVRGAYTDAHTEQRGMVALADKGTLFLDEIDSLSLSTQAKLLRFLQDHEFRPLGSERYLRSDVRIIAASNRNLKELVEEKQFRSDLYFRLNVLHLGLPPLRERPQDIPLLARHFLALHAPAGERKGLSPAALCQLMSYAWPGNIRELENVIQRAILFSRGAQISGGDIALPGPVLTLRPLNFRVARAEAIQEFERGYVNYLLLRNKGNITRAAKEAGQERRAFGRLAKRHNRGPGTPPPGQF